MNNMEIYEYARSVPDYAKKPISGGRLNGKTDIRPQWRTQVLTEMFGPCGFGWKYEIVSQRTEPGEGKEVKAFVDVNLYVKWGDEWSAAIPGIGGNSYIDNKGYVNDECYKMALTDALSVACKALGIGADVYMGAERTKYTAPEEPQTRPADNPPPPQKTQQNEPQLPPPASDGYWYCEDCKQIVNRVKLKDGSWASPQQIVALGMKRYGKCLCGSCMTRREAK